MASTDCHTLRYLVASESIVSLACRSLHSRSGSVGNPCKAIEHPNRLCESGVTEKPQQGRTRLDGRPARLRLGDTVELAEQRLALKLEMTDQRAALVVEAARRSSVDSPNDTRGVTVRQHEFETELPCCRIVTCATIEG